MSQMEASLEGLCCPDGGDEAAAMAMDALVLYSLNHRRNKRHNNIM